MLMEDDLADALLDGELPESVISDQTLIEIARVINYDANLLRLMLGRPITPNHQAEEAQH
jgi:hypothetical protein